MKAFLLFPLALALVVTGCGDSKPAAPAAGAGSPITAPVDYLGALNKAKKSAEKTVDLSVITTAVNAFKQEEGRFPLDLTELMKHSFLRSIPPAPYGMKIVYNPTNGEVAVVKATPPQP